MLKKLKSRVEKKRNSKNLFWKSLILIKDFIWRSKRALYHFKFKLEEKLLRLPWNFKLFIGRFINSYLHREVIISDTKENKKMKIALICPGLLSVPPKGYGAIEIIVWEYYKGLIKRGYDAKIYNTKNVKWLKKELEKRNYDFVHLHWMFYLPFLESLKIKAFAVTAHDGQFHNKPDRVFNYLSNTEKYIFTVSKEIKNVLIEKGHSNPNKIFVFPNGVNCELMQFRKKPKYIDRSIYLGKIQKRKRQHLYSGHDLNMDFVGNGPSLNVSKSNRFLGSWTKKHEYKSLTNYANLVLLSSSEAQPLVCVEALAAGLGLVISEAASANLDTSKEFIDVIPNHKVEDIKYIKRVIEKNRQESLKRRNEIRQYALDKFSWETIIDNYLKKIESIIKNPPKEISVGLL